MAASASLINRMGQLNKFFITFSRGGFFQGRLPKVVGQLFFTIPATATMTDFGITSEKESRWVKKLFMNASRLWSVRNLSLLTIRPRASKRAIKVLVPPISMVKYMLLLYHVTQGEGETNERSRSWT